MLTHMLSTHPSHLSRHCLCLLHEEIISFPNYRECVVAKVQWAKEPSLTPPSYLFSVTN